MALSSFSGLPAIELVGLVPVGYLGLVSVVAFCAIFTRKKARRDAALEVLKMLLPKRHSGRLEETGQPQPSELEPSATKRAEPAGPAPSGRDDRI
ncbi:hypothetical protein ABTX61_00935 [Amycolatopsis japonica]|uniref:hypothetical protein n=1 Tax=Amycolatopsis japonica TaxID=208439 RepID=UPI00331C8102